MQNPNAKKMQKNNAKGRAGNGFGARPSVAGRVPPKYTAVTDGCAHGLKDKHGIPHLQPWRIVTSKWEVAENLGARRCCHPKGFKHSKIEGSKTAGTARYPRAMAVTIIHSLYPSLAASIPAMPVMPFEQHEHAPNDTPPPAEEVYAAIHQLLDRKDWEYPGAQECIDGEANGLIDNGTWNYEEVVPRKELLERNPVEHRALDDHSKYQTLGNPCLKETEGSDCI